MRYSAAPQQLCETCRCGKRAQISELEHTIAVRGPQSQRKSSSADAPVCKDREHKLCNLSSYCAAPQPLCSASCGGKCARKWHLHSSSHTCQHALRQRALTPPHAAPKRSPACPLSSLAPCQTRPRRARRALRANGCRAKLPGEAILPWRGPRGARAAARRPANLPGGTWRTRRCPRRPAPRPPPARPTCKVRPRPRSPVFRGAHGRLAPPTGRARPSGACQTCRAEAGAPGGALAVPLRARLLYPAHSGLLNPILRGYTLVVFLLFSGGPRFVQSTILCAN